MLLGARHRDADSFDHSIAYVSAAHRDLAHEVAATGVPVHLLGGGRAWDIRWIGRLRRAMARADVVHVHSPVPAVAARLANRTIRRSRRPALVTTEHNVWDSHHPITRLAEDLTFHLDDAHLAVSDAVRRSLPDSKQEGVEVLVQGVDLSAVRGSTDRASARSEMGVDEATVVVGTVANLRPQKGYLDLLRAASIVLGKATDVRFVAVGKGPQEAEVRDLHRELGLGDGFTLLGYRPDAVRLMSGFDLLCMASHHEGLPVALMEALVLGLPVVATTAGGIPELVEEGVEGRLVPPRRPDLLADALLALLTPDGSRASMAKAAAERGRELDVSRSIRRHEAIYDGLARGRRG